MTGAWERAMSPQEIHAQALIAAVEMFGDGRDIHYVLHVAETFFVPFITTGARQREDQP